MIIQEPVSRTSDRAAAGVPTPHWASDITGLQIVMVNVYFVGAPQQGDERDGSWVLVDAALPLSAGRIQHAARQRFGDRPPQAIVLTHGHFDHRGALSELLEEWDVPVYAHEMELPYLTGRAAYPPPDPTVGGGMMARLSPLYPRRPIDLEGRVQALPADGTVPMMPGWRWIPTPGHSPGHVSFFRDADRALIAGDAFVTTKQESATAVLTQRTEIHGPPMYFTQDWPAAADSVRRLAALHPSAAFTGHGLPMYGPALDEALQDLAAHFEQRAVPCDGRYVRERAIFDQRGPLYVPPPVSDPMPKIVAGVAIAGALMWILTRSRREDGDAPRKRGR